MYPEQKRKERVIEYRYSRESTMDKLSFEPFTKSLPTSDVSLEKMKVLVWCCGFEERFAGPHLFREAERQGLNVRVAGSRNRPEQFMPEFMRFKPDWVFCFAIRESLRPYYTAIRSEGSRLLFWYPDQCDRLRDYMWKRKIAHYADVAVFSILHTAVQYRNLFPLTLWMPQYFDQQQCLGSNGQLPKRLNPDKPIYDLCFIGSVDKRRRSWLEHLMEKGYNCKFVIHKPRMLNEIRGYKMAEAYAQSKIAFNIQREQFLNPGPFITSNRCYNAMGSGCFFINHYVNQLHLMWEEEKHCVTYDDTLKDLCKKIDYYLTHEDQRERIAQCGQADVLQFHTLEQRIKEYWQVMHQILQGYVPKTEENLPRYGKWTHGLQ